MSARAEHSWQIASGDGTPLAELTTAAGKTLTFQRNSFVEAQATISHEDEAAALLLDALNDGIPQLRVYRRSAGAATSDLIFRGYLAPFTEEAEETSLLSLVFRSPFSLLMGDGSERGRFTSESRTITPGGLTADAGAIVADLVDAANEFTATGLVMGTVETSAQRERLYQYANIGQSIVDLTGVLDGFDFDETFIESGATLSQLNVWARLGQDKPEARFEYGEDTLNNVRSLSRTTQPPINDVRVLGANGLVGTGTDATSIAKYGRWVAQYSASDIGQQSALDERAQALLRPNPIRTVEFSPEWALENCPSPFDDFNVGDSVPFFARRGALVEDVTVRLNGMTLTVDENGMEATEISDPLTPGEEATIRSQLALEVEATA